MLVAGAVGSHHEDAVLVGACLDGQLPGVAEHPGGVGVVLGRLPVVLGQRPAENDGKKPNGLMLWPGVVLQKFATNI